MLQPRVKRACATSVPVQRQRAHPAATGESPPARCPMPSVINVKCCLQGRNVGEGGASREHACKSQSQAQWPCSASPSPAHTGGVAQRGCTLFGASTGCQHRLSGSGGRQRRRRSGGGWLRVAPAPRPADETALHSLHMMPSLPAAPQPRCSARGGPQRQLAVCHSAAPGLYRCAWVPCNDRTMPRGRSGCLATRTVPLSLLGVTIVTPG